MRALEDLNKGDGNVTRDQYEVHFVVSPWNNPAVKIRGAKFPDKDYAVLRAREEGGVLMNAFELTEAMNSGEISTERHATIHVYIKA